ncbi:MAG: hypothetical protein KatS3mg103_0694 [Phycisphaerales bacterium]|nr:MAG: hypothetical protein KatS3mg103_0694 [Phycisphaerales bacterium]
MRDLLELDASLQPVGASISAYLQRVADRFDQALRSDLLAVQRLTDHVERYRGKMLRPALVALSAGAAGGRAAGGAGRSGRRSGAGDRRGRCARWCTWPRWCTTDVLDEAETRPPGADGQRDERQTRRR